MEIAKNIYSNKILKYIVIAFAGSIQDIAIDAYRIESAKLEDQGNLAAGYQFGYRLAILVGSSLALIYAANFSWSLTCLIRKARLAAFSCL